LGLKRKLEKAEPVCNGNLNPLVDKSKRLERPSNFSQVCTNLEDSEIKKRFPLFLKARDQRMHVELSTGDMLFIPAGLFLC